MTRTLRLLATYPVTWAGVVLQDLGDAISYYGRRTINLSHKLEGLPVRRLLDGNTPTEDLTEPTERGPMSTSAHVAGS